MEAELESESESESGLESGSESESESELGSHRHLPDWWKESTTEEAQPAVRRSEPILRSESRLGYTTCTIHTIRNSKFADTPQY
jgi:hypothetical protein